MRTNASRAFGFRSFFSARSRPSLKLEMPTKRFEPKEIRNKHKREEVARKNKRAKGQAKLQRRLEQAKLESKDPLAKKVCSPA